LNKGKKQREMERKNIGLESKREEKEERGCKE